MNNSVHVSWGGAMTDYFTALNRVKQGAVLSPIVHCVYVDDKAAVLSVYTAWTHLHTHMTTFY